MVAVLLTAVISACGGGGGGGPEQPNERQVPTIRWQLPSLRVDGTELPTQEIAEIEIWYSENSDEPQLLTTVDGDTTSYVPDELAPGSYQLFLTVVDMDFLRSDASEVIALQIP